MTLVINQSSSRKNFDNGLRDFLDIGELRGGGGGAENSSLEFCSGLGREKMFSRLMRVGRTCSDSSLVRG